jgi:hypothetical protein
MAIYQLQALEAACNTTANSYSTASNTTATHTVRVVNISTGPLTLTLQSNSSTNVGSMTILGNSEVIIVKPLTYLLQSSAVGSVNCLAVPIVYRGN